MFWREHRPVSAQTGLLCTALREYDAPRPLTVTMTDGGESGWMDGRVGPGTRRECSGRGQ